MICNNHEKIGNDKETISNKLATKDQNIIVVNGKIVCIVEKIVYLSAILLKETCLIEEPFSAHPR